ncbi:MAG: KTSC domain-containing protein [Caulobacterales bacterium]|nr:KTSC domain-containing protein [Caulobacterales bacterium]
MPALGPGNRGDREAATRVESAVISDIRYEDDRQKLFVRFEGSGEYVYVGVPGEVHRSFIEAESKGRFFADRIRDRFPCNRLDG